MEEDKKQALPERKNFHFPIKGETYIYQVFKYLNYKPLEVGDKFELVSYQDQMFTIKIIDEKS